MSFDNSKMNPQRVFKPHIQFVEGYWRISMYPNYPCLPNHIHGRWVRTHSVVNRWNEAREFGMVVPGTT